jgi:hypothetical protein
MPVEHPVISTAFEVDGDTLASMGGHLDGSNRPVNPSPAPAL